MSLGLVSYDDSDESENESGSEEKVSFNKNPLQNNVTPFHSNKNLQTHIVSALSNVSSVQISDDEIETTKSTGNQSKVSSDEESEPKQSTDKSVNIHIPESKLSLINTDIDIKSLTSSKKKNGPVKIIIPSLNEVIDDSEPPSKKKLKPSQKGSGLFALLPNPKSSLVPQSVMNKKPLNPSARKQNLAPMSTKKPPLTAKIPTRPKPSTLITYEDSGDEDEISETVDFFSLDSKNNDITPASVDINIDFANITESGGQITINKPDVMDQSDGVNSTSNWVNTSGWQDPAHSSNWEENSSVQSSSSSGSGPQASDTYTTSQFMSFSQNDLGLDQEAMQQLCGRRDRLKMQDVSLIDVSGDAIMPDSREWLTKQLTEEVAHRPSHKRKDGPTTQQKRKHQITYLAYQAKENELELKNQWANNRMSRKQTQAKYGF